MNILFPHENIRKTQEEFIKDIQTALKEKKHLFKYVLFFWWEVFILYRLFRKEKFDVIHTHTPKAGLLGSVAAKLAGVPVIMHTNLGFYFHEHSPFLQKRFYIFIERLSVMFASDHFSVDKQDIEKEILSFLNT